MKIIQQNINTIYTALGVGSLNSVSPEEIVKIMKIRKAFRPYFEAYRAFEDDVRKAQPNYDKLSEIENKVDKSEEDKTFYIENIKAFITGVNMAIIPELNKEIEIDVESLLPETIALVVSRTNAPLDVLEILCKD